VCGRVAAFSLAGVPSFLHCCSSFVRVGRQCLSRFLILLLCARRLVALSVATSRFVPFRPGALGPSQFVLVVMVLSLCGGPQRVALALGDFVLLLQLSMPSSPALRAVPAQFLYEILYVLFARKKILPSTVDALLSFTDMVLFLIFFSLQLILAALLLYYFFYFSFYSYSHELAASW
jgi:hypothetical protein